MRGQLRERQVCHAPADSSLLEVARDEQLAFVRVTDLLPNAFALRIAPRERLFDGVESVDQVMHVTPRKAGREAVIPGCRIVENYGFGNAFGHDRILPRRWWINTPGRDRDRISSMRLTNMLLFVIAALLAFDVARVSSVHAAPTRVRVQTISKSGSVDLDGKVVGSSCVNKGAYTECSIASR